MVMSIYDDIPFWPNLLNSATSALVNAIYVKIGKKNQFFLCRYKTSHNY